MKRVLIALAWVGVRCTDADVRDAAGESTFGGHEEVIDCADDETEVDVVDEFNDDEIGERETETPSDSDATDAYVENRDIYDSKTDTYTDWPYTGPLTEECWRYTPEIDGEDIALNGASWLAVDGDTIYYQTASLQQDDARSFLHAISSEGQPLWHVETWDMMLPLPPIVDDDGSILLVAQSIQIPSRTQNGVRVQKWSKNGVKLWEQLGDATVADRVYTYDRQLGSSAGAIDEDNNLYFVTGAYLRSLDSKTGKIRWQKNVVPDGTLNSGPWTATPTVVDNLVYIVDDSMTLLVLDSVDGSVVIQRKGLFVGIGTTWMSASRAGFIFAPAYAHGLVTLTLDGEIIGLADSGFGDTVLNMAGSDDAGVIYARNLYGGIRAVLPDVSEVWASTGWTAEPQTGFIIDTMGHVALKSSSNDKFSVMVQATGDLIFDKHPFAITYGQPVVSRPGEAILIARVPFTDRPHLKCIKVPPIGPPDPNAWSTAHGSFKNQRRLRTFVSATP